MARQIDTDLLRYYMWRRGIRTKAGLARATGLTRVTINNLMSGIPPKHETISSIIDALEIPEEKIGAVFYAKEEPAGRTDSSE